MKKKCVRHNKTSITHDKMVEHHVIFNTTKNQRGVIFSKFKVKELSFQHLIPVSIPIYIYTYGFFYPVEIRNFTTTILFNHDIDFHMIYGDV